MCALAVTLSFEDHVSCSAAYHPKKKASLSSQSVGSRLQSPVPLDSLEQFISSDWCITADKLDDADQNKALSASRASLGDAYKQFCKQRKLTAIRAGTLSRRLYNRFGSTTDPEGKRVYHGVSLNE
jgi:hypothetical protein